MFDEQHTPEQVTEYEVAREILGRYLGKALAAERAATDPADRDRYDTEVSDLEQRRQTLRVGSPEAARIVAEAKAAHAADIARE
jgi:hypothetical protein